MQDMILMPSPNSAFTPTGNIERESISPSSQLRKRLLFDGKLSARKEPRAELSEVMRNTQSAFLSRWNCRCDVIVGSCYGHRVEPIKTAKIPKCDWSPIDPSSDTESKSIQGSDTRSSKRIRRPVAPVPFTNRSQSHSRVCNKENNHTSHVMLPEGCLTPPSSPESCDLSKANETSPKQSDSNGAGSNLQTLDKNLLRNDKKEKSHSEQKQTVFTEKTKQ